MITSQGFPTSEGPGSMAFSWKRGFSNLCSAPVAEIAHDRLDLAHPALRFHRYWIALPRQDGLPDRKDFQPAEIPGVLPWIMAFDAVPASHGTDYILRLHGTKAAEMTYGDYTGQPLEAFTAQECLDSRRHMLTTALAEKRVYYGFAKIDTKCEYRTDARLGAFPFRSGEGHQVFVVVAPDNIDLRNLM